MNATTYTLIAETLDDRLALLELAMSALEKSLDEHVTEGGARI